MAYHGKLEAVLLRCMVALGSVSCGHYQATSVTRLRACALHVPGPAVILGCILLHLSVSLMKLDTG